MYEVAATIKADKVQVAISGVTSSRHAGMKVLLIVARVDNTELLSTLDSRYATVYYEYAVR